MPVLQIKDKDGTFIPINAIKGNDGKSAYEQAKEGGYTGTEEEFISLLNGLISDAEGYAKMETITYLGTGTYCPSGSVTSEKNKQNITKITFSFPPKVVFIGDTANGMAALVAVNGQELGLAFDSLDMSFCVEEDRAVEMAWEGCSLMLCNSLDDWHQYNCSGDLYVAVAIG